MHISVSSDLSLVGDAKHLIGSRQVFQPATHSVRDSSSDAAVNFVEDADCAETLTGSQRS